MMSSALESERAIVGVQVGYYCETGRERVAKFDKPAMKTTGMFQVTQIVRFLLEPAGLSAVFVFVTLVFLRHNLM